MNDLRTKQLKTKSGDILGRCHCHILENPCEPKWPWAKRHTPSEGFQTLQQIRQVLSPKQVSATMFASQRGGCCCACSTVTFCCLRQRPGCGQSQSIGRPMCSQQRTTFCPIYPKRSGLFTAQHPTIADRICPGSAFSYQARDEGTSRIGFGVIPKRTGMRSKHGVNSWIV